MSMTPYTFDLEPGQTKHQTFGEANFIFVDFADRELEVSINGSWQTLRKGTKFKSRTGMFDQFEIRNPDPNNPCRVVMFIGTDEIENLIVEGEIGIVPLLRNADGTTKPDTRHTLRIDVAPSNLALTSYVRGNLVSVWKAPPRYDGSQFNLSSNRGYAFKGRDGAFTFYGLDTSAASSEDYKHRFFRYDKNMNLIGEDVFPRVAVFTPFSWTYRPGVGYQYVSQEGSTDRLRTLNSDGTVAEVKNFGNTGTFRWPFWSPELGIYISAATNRINALPGTYGDVYELLSVTASSGPTAYDPVTQEIQNAYFSSLRCYDLDGNLTRSISGNDGGNFSYGFSTINREKNQTLVADAPNVAAVVALEDFTTKPEFVVRREDCGLASGFYRPNNIPQITANIAAEQLPNGVVLTGEVIRAALEYFYRRAVSDGYLDHVYALDLTATETGVPFPQIVTGNETFKRAGIKDDFGFLTPGQVVLTIDNELKLGAPL